MKQTDSFEQEVVLYDSQDGLGDIFAGLLILSFGAGVLSGIFWLGGILVPVLFPVWQDAKKRLGRRRKVFEATPVVLERARTNLAMMAAVGVLTLMLGFVVFALFSQEDLLPGVHAWLREYFELALGGLAALLLAVIGIIIRAGRYFLYAVLAIVIFTAGYLYQVNLGISMTLLGGWVFLAGLVVLLRFLREHPAH